MIAAEVKKIRGASGSFASTQMVGFAQLAGIPDRQAKAINRPKPTFASTTVDLETRSSRRRAPESP